MKWATRSLCSVSMTCGWYPLEATISARCIGSGVRTMPRSLPADPLLEVREDDVDGGLRFGAGGARADDRGVLLAGRQALLAVGVRLGACLVERRLGQHVGLL